MRSWLLMAVALLCVGSSALAQDSLPPQGDDRDIWEKAPDYSEDLGGIGIAILFGKDDFGPESGLDRKEYIRDLARRLRTHEQIYSKPGELQIRVGVFAKNGDGQFTDVTLYVNRTPITGSSQGIADAFLSTGKTVMTFRQGQRQTQRGHISVADSNHHVYAYRELRDALGHLPGPLVFRGLGGKTYVAGPTAAGFVIYEFDWQGFAQDLEADGYESAEASGRAAAMTRLRTQHLAVNFLLQQYSSYDPSRILSLARGAAPLLDLLRESSR